MIQENDYKETILPNSLFTQCAQQFSSLFIVLFFLFGAVDSVQSQTLIQGEVRDSFTNEAIIGYSLVIRKNDRTYISGTTGDINGKFEIAYPKYNWLILKFSHIGYETKIFKVNKETLQPFYNITLVPVAKQIEDLEIVATPYHYFNTAEIGEISIDKNHPGMAASFGDPSRSVLRFPGTGAQSDQANGFSYHGLPNEMVNWKLEGAEILNPNHLNTAGTISNRSSSNSGGVLALPFEVLDKYTFLTAPFSKTHGNAIGGISNISPRKINPDRNGFAKVGLLGMEAGISKEFTPETGLQFHYRYSFTGLLGDMGIDFDGEKISYQDLFLRMDFVKGKDKGVSLILFAGANKNTKNDLIFQNTEGILGSAGIHLYRHFNEKSSINTSIFVSLKNDDGFTSFRDNTTFNPSLTNLLFDRQTKFSLFTEYRYEVSPGKTHLIGINLNHWDFRYGYTETEEETASRLFFSNTDRAVQYGNISYGLEIKNNDWIIKPEFALALTPQNNIYLEPGFTLGRDLQKFKFLLGANFANQNQEAAIYGLAEKELDRRSAGQFELENNKAINSYASVSYRLSNVKRSVVSLKLFNHYLFNLPIPDNTEAYFPYTGLDYMRPAKLRNEGIANSRGIEMSLDHSFSDDLQFVLNGSAFRSVYQRDGENINYPAPNNFGFTTNMFATKKFQIGSGDLFLSLAGHFRGGAYAPKVDKENSVLTKRIIYSSEFLQLGNYLRLDGRINYTFKKKNQIILDIQNLSNTKNDAFFNFDHVTGEELVEKQLGLIPVMSYRREF